MGLFRTIPYWPLAALRLLLPLHTLYIPFLGAAGPIFSVNKVADLAADLAWPPACKGSAQTHLQAAPAGRATPSGEQLYTIADPPQLRIGVRGPSSTKNAK